MSAIPYNVYCFINSVDKLSTAIVDAQQEMGFSLLSNILVELPATNVEMSLKFPYFGGANKYS